MSDQQDEDGNIEPDTAVLYAWCNSRMTFAAVFGELIDNAFDAGATWVRIEATGKDLIVTDNGAGCESLVAMLKAGKHIKRATTRLGRYGVGLKDSALWLNGITRIHSVHRGTARRVFADWERIARSGVWKIPPTTTRVAEPGEEGTTLHFQNITRKVPTGKAFDDLVAEIGYLYSPALKGSDRVAPRQIQFIGKGRKDVLAPRFYLPARLDHVVDCDVSVGGKIAHVHVGVVPEGVPNPRPGISYTHGFRVIIPATGLGCGGRNPSRIAGWVSLDGEWRLNKNKDGVNVDEDELGEAVYAVIRDTVEKGARQSMSVRSAALSNNLTSMLRGMVGEGDAVRDQTGAKRGTVDPKNSNRVHRNATKTRAGSSRRTVNVGRLRIDFKPCIEPLLGEADLRCDTVFLAENHPWIARLRRNENLEALLSEALWVLCTAEKDAQRAFKWFRDAEKEGRELDSHSVVGSLLKDQQCADLKAVA